MDYQLSTQQTAIYPKERGLEYCIYGLIGEVGELANKYKKVIRDRAGIMDQPTKDVMIGELGDVCWYLSQIGNELSFDLRMPEEGSKSEHPILELENCVGFFVSDFLCGQITIREDIEEMFRECLAIAEHMLDTTLDNVLRLNLDKLFSRKERGVLGGSGDNR